MPIAIMCLPKSSMMNSKARFSESVALNLVITVVQKNGKSALSEEKAGINLSSLQR